MIHRNMDNWDDWLRRITDDAPQEEIAKRIGVSRATVARWSTRKVIDPETVLKLARAYGVDPVEGLVAGGWLKLEDITVEGFRKVIGLAPTLFLVQELLARAEADHEALMPNSADTFSMPSIIRFGEVLDR